MNVAYKNVHAVLTHKIFAEVESFRLKFKNPLVLEFLGRQRSLNTKWEKNGVSSFVLYGSKPFWKVKRIVKTTLPAAGDLSTFVVQIFLG